LFPALDFHLSIAYSHSVFQPQIAIRVHLICTKNHFILLFEIYDSFYSEKNQAELSSRIADVEAGKNLTAHELIETELASRNR